MSNKELFVKAHGMTKEIKREYPEVDYMLQFSLCLAYLQEGEKKMVELKGTEKQIAWAEDIRKNYLDTLEGMMENVKNENMGTIKMVMREYKSEIVSKVKEKTTPEAARVILDILTEIKNKIENTDSAKKFIEVYNGHRFSAPHEVSTMDILGQFR